MNKFVKVVLILAAVLFGIGVVCTIAAFAMGVTWDNVNDIGIRRIDGINYNLSSDTQKEEEDGKLFFDGVQNLSIESGAAAIQISYAQVDSVEVHYDTVVGMSAKMDDGQDLEIECGFSASGQVEVLVPEGMQLDEVDLDIGAGRIELNDVAFRELDADVGAGELIIAAPDAADNYDYEVDCGLGEIVIGDEIYSGVTSTEKFQGGNKRFSIECGAGRVAISFAE